MTRDRALIVAACGSGHTVAYLRTATANPVESRLGLARQQDTCEDFAGSLGVQITRVYLDVGVSGLSEERPALTQTIPAYSSLRRFAGDPLLSEGGELRLNVAAFTTLQRSQH